MKNNIFTKIFLVTASVFTIFLLIVLNMGTYFLETFYMNNLVEDMYERGQWFAEHMEDEGWNPVEMARYLNIHVKSDNITAAIIDDSYNMLYEKEFLLIVETSDEKLKKVHLNNVLVEDSFYYDRIKYGDKVAIHGFFWGDDPSDMTPLKIDVNGKEWIDISGDMSLKNLDRVSGTIIGLTLPSDEELVKGIGNQDLWIAFDYYLLDNKYHIKGEEPTDFTFENPTDESISIATVFPLDGYTLLMITPKSQILDVTGLMREFFYIVIIFAIVVTLIISFFISMFISRPLIQLDRRAQKMADFEFDEFIDIKAQDEIGSLSLSLNKMAFNLKIALDELTMTNEQLTQEIQLEKKLEASRTEFISNVSHELKTPLGIIRGFAEGIQDGVSGDNTDYYVDVILDEVDKMDQMVLDMLDTMRMTEGNYAFNQAPFDVNALITELLEKYRMIANVEISCNSCGFPLYLLGDEIEVEKLIMNFIGNACKYNIDDELIVIESIVKNGQYYFSIENKCEDIPEEKLEHIWEKFYRVDSSRSSDINGTGLGLAISKNILEMHRWEYDVLKTEGKIKFFFIAPIHMEKP